MSYDGRPLGTTENLTSAHHRKLLNEAKEFSDKAKELKKQIDDRKQQLENRVRNDIPLYDYAEEAKVLGVKAKKEVIVETQQDTKEETQAYRYYLTQRPPAPGAIPRGSINTVSFDTKEVGNYQC